MFNRVILIGRLTRDPELTYTPQGTAVCKFTLAINRKFNKEEVDFVDIVAWRGLAENAANYLGKGRMAAVEGRMQVRTYEAKDGGKRKQTEVIADDIRFLDKGSGSGTSSSSNQQREPEPDPWDDVSELVQMDEDSIPY